MSSHERAMSRIAVAMIAFILAAPASLLRAQTCTVPGSHTTIQGAVDDRACATITLADQVYPESIVISRSLTVAGPAAGVAVVQGLVLITGSGTLVTLRDLKVENGCVPDALRASKGAKLTGDNLQVERSAGLPCPAITDTIFADGFESGNTAAWSSTSP